MAASAHDLRELEQDPRLFLYTSLTAGSSHIITATSRMETILKANRIPFVAIDTATDEKARRLWARRAGKRKIPGLVKEGFVIGDLEQVEEWNEFGELKENIGPVPASNAAPPAKALAKPAATEGGAAESQKSDPAPVQQRIALPGAAEIAARNNKPAPTSDPTLETSTASTTKPETPASPPSGKHRAVKIAGEDSREDHLSAPPSAIASGTASPAQPAAEADATTLSAVPKSVKQEQSGIDHLSAPPSQVASGTATPSGPLTSGSKGETLSALPKALQLEESRVDHLSAPPSQFQSGTASPAEPASEDTVAGASAEPVTSTAAIKTERGGSEIRDAPENLVKEVEKSTSISEEPEVTEGVTKGVEGLQVGSGAATQEQKAKDAGEAGNSVED